MAKYFTNFEDSDIDDNPPVGLTRRWAASSVPGSYSQVVEQRSIGFKKRAILQSASASGFNAISLDAVDADASRATVQALALVEFDSTMPTSVWLVLRGSGSAGTETGYCCGIDVASNTGYLLRQNGGSVAGLTTGSLGVTVAAGQKWFIRAEATGTTIRVRCWQLGSTEPTTWTASTTDSAISAAGWVGTFVYKSSGTGRAHWQFLSVGTNGDAAPMPVLDSEYLTWLQNPANPTCVLAELAATGYDTGGAPYTKTIKAYLSTAPYLSAQQDSPASTQYQPIIQSPPTFRREMGEALYGEASAGFGELVITNPVDPATSAGVRDDWLRCKWQAENVLCLLGAPTWPRHDFRKIVVGRLAQPVASQPGQIRFGITGLADMLDTPLQTNYYANTVVGLANQQKPILLGAPAVVEPVQVDEATNQYQVHDGPLTGDLFVYDDGLPIDSPAVTISAVDTGTDTITTSAAHGLLAGYSVTFTGSVPAPLATSTPYWVKTTPTTTTFTLAATEGGATINLTTGTTGALIEGLGYWPVFASPDGLFKLAAPASGRVFAVAVQDTGTDSAYPANMMDWVVFTKGGISANYKDASTFTALAAALGADAGVYFEPGNAISIKDALFQVAQGAWCWAGWSPDGLLQVGQITLPTNSPVQTFTENDVQADSLVLRKVMLPVDMTTSDVVYGKSWLRGGPLGAYRSSFQSLFRLEDRHTYSATTPPLDDDPTLSECRRGQRFETIFNSVGFTATLATLYGKKLGIFEVVINHLGPAVLSIGDTIRLTHARLGWKQWGSTEASPDNSNTVDSRHAVVLGQEVDVTARTVRLTLLRQMPGYYPESDFAP